MKLDDLIAFNLEMFNELRAARKLAMEDPTASWPELRDGITRKRGMGDVYSFVEME
jgi:hypothetical protein